jgi:hypothetical protein
MLKFRFVAMLAAGLALAAGANAAPSHALAKTAKVTLSGIKKSLGAVVFAVEDGVDVVHLATSGANKALQAAAPAKILVPVQKAVAFADEYVGKADSGLEHVETVLFGSSN